MYYHGRTVMQFACGLLYSMSCRCLIVSLLFPLCLLLFVVLINCFILLIIRFMFVLLFYFLFCVYCVCVLYLPMYKGAAKFLARPGRKQARKHVRDARDFNNIEKRAVI